MEDVEESKQKRMGVYLEKRKDKQREVENLTKSFRKKEGWREVEEGSFSGKGGKEWLSRKERKDAKGKEGHIWGFESKEVKHVLEDEEVKGDRRKLSLVKTEGKSEVFKQVWKSWRMKNVGDILEKGRMEEEKEGRREESNEEKGWRHLGKGAGGRTKRFGEEKRGKTKNLGKEEKHL